MNYMTHHEAIEMIKELMKEQGITQRELAIRNNVTEASFSRWINQSRKMPFEVISKSLDILGYMLICAKKRG